MKADHVIRSERGSLNLNVIGSGSGNKKILGKRILYNFSAMIGMMYRVVLKIGTGLLSTSLVWPAVAGCSQAETFSQLSSISFAQPCTERGGSSFASF